MSAKTFVLAVAVVFSSISICNIMAAIFIASLSPTLMVLLGLSACITGVIGSAAFTASNDDDHLKELDK